MSNYARIEIKSDFDFMINEMIFSESMVERITDIFTQGRMERNILPPSVIECDNKRKESKDFYFVLYVKSLSGLAKPFSFAIFKGSKEEKDSYITYKADIVYDIIPDVKSISEIKTFVNENYSHKFYINNGNSKLDAAFDRLFESNRGNNLPRVHQPSSFCPSFGSSPNLGTPQEVYKMLERNEKFIKMFDDVRSINEKDCDTKEKLRMIVDMYNITTENKYSGVVQYDGLPNDLYLVLEKISKHITDNVDLNNLLFMIVSLFIQKQ